VEARLGRWLGARRVLWLRRGAIPGDDTDGHVDTLARFAGPGTLIYQSCDDRGDEAWEGLQGLREDLQALTRADGRPYRLVALPWPRPVHDGAGRRLPATYANFLVVNGTVLVPGYNDPADTRARAAIGACFPGRQAITVDATALIRQSGSLHCVTMQLPAGVLPGRA
jgi:agmatine/peptidylarginine deiminase